MTEREEQAITVLNTLYNNPLLSDIHRQALEVGIMAIKALEQEPKTGHCKDCKYFEYDIVAEVHGIPLIIAHEICKRWSDGCKTSEDGYCFLFEPKEGSEE